MHKLDINIIGMNANDSTAHELDEPLLLILGWKSTKLCINTQVQIPLVFNLIKQNIKPIAIA